MSADKILITERSPHTFLVDTTDPGPLSIEREIVTKTSHCITLVHEGSIHFWGFDLRTPFFGKDDGSLHLFTLSFTVVPKSDHIRIYQVQGVDFYSPNFNDTNYKMDFEDDKSLDFTEFGTKFSLNMSTRFATPKHPVPKWAYDVSVPDQ